MVLHKGLNDKLSVTLPGVVVMNFKRRLVIGSKEHQTPRNLGLRDRDWTLILETGNALIVSGGVSPQEPPY